MRARVTHTYRIKYIVLSRITGCALISVSFTIKKGGSFDQSDVVSSGPLPGVGFIYINIPITLLLGLDLLDLWGFFVCQVNICSGPFCHSFIMDIKVGDILF